EVAARNVERHHMGERVELTEGDLLAPAPADLDLVLANLPYVAPGTDLPREVRAEPEHALFAGDGGSALVNRLLEQAPEHLRPGGVLLAELDEGVAERVRGLDAYISHELRRDLAGRVRVLEAHR
ncbi:MAG: peptide chain release factor N(5)-glutamine methyltransferase, partial [Candidatus Dormibacteraceae bacterium]